LLRKLLMMEDLAMAAMPYFGVLTTPKRARALPLGV
jgi:hypothetical protein